MQQSGNTDKFDPAVLSHKIKQWGHELGFQQTGITGIDLAADEKHLTQWLDRNFHGSMSYMRRHGTKRSRPDELIPGTVSIISVRLDYTDQHAHDAQNVLANPDLAYVSRYALGRDYHKVMRKQLKLLAAKISDFVQASDLSVQHRVFVDSAPVLEKALARNAGLGWIGKHTNLINKDAGSWFFLGELFTDIPLQHDSNAEDHCGSCTACMEVCPTEAIVAPYQVDARRCISYLTIENRGEIPEELRRPMGNRIYGCDDCQLFCPWNKFAQTPEHEDFRPRHQLENSELADLFAWSEQEFDKNTQGSAIRRTGYTGWLRNIAVALGNASSSASVIAALESRRHHSSELVREHVNWALAQHRHNVDT